MKKFLYDVLFFSLILFAVLKAIKFTVPYYWGNDLVAYKMKYLEATNLEFNTYFIGSSKTYRHINPAIFEKITGNSAFNLGAAGTYAIETEYLIDNLISRHNLKQVENIYLQGINHNFYEAKNRHSIRANYFLDAKRTFRAIKYFFYKKNYQQVYYYSIGYIENQLCIGQIIKILKFNFVSSNNLNGKIFDQNGFYSLDQDLADNNIKGFKKRNNNFKNKNLKKMKTEKLNIEKLDFEELGVTKYPSLTKLWYITGNPLSNTDYYFDFVHYNNKGANIFTNQIGNIVIELRENN